MCPSATQSSTCHQINSIGFSSQCSREEPKNLVPLQILLQIFPSMKIDSIILIHGNLREPNCCRNQQKEHIGSLSFGGKVPHLLVFPSYHKNVSTAASECKKNPFFNELMRRSLGVVGACLMYWGCDCFNWSHHGVEHEQCQKFEMWFGNGWNLLKDVWEMQTIGGAKF